MLSRFMILPAFALGCLLAGTPFTAAHAQERNESASFSVSIRGLTAGTFALAATQNGSGYALKSRAASTGLAGFFRPFSVVSTTKGTVGKGGFQPLSYMSISDGARSGRGAELRYVKGVPEIVSVADEPEPDAPVVDPASQAGTVDPLTASYAVLRTVPQAELCKLSVRIFDGHRASRITLSGPIAGQEQITCTGVYQRVDGYPPKELAERSEFPFSLTYAPAADGQLQVVELLLDSSFGPARVTRN